MHIHFLSDFHVGHRCIKSFDHHACSAHELKRFASVIRGIKLCSVVERSSVVRLTCLADIPAFDRAMRTTSATALSLFMSAASMSVLVTATGMSLTMMIAIGSGIDQFAPQICFHCCICISACSCAKLDSILLQSTLCSSADSSADQYIDCMLIQKPRQRTVSASIRAQNFRRNNFIILYLIKLKCFRMPKMLKHFSIVICYCNFHLFLFSSFPD